ncbi:MAG TPA: glycine zipper 2TM domain-containing protein [Frateuria sp.]|uniref:glycine zipper 2TM domain-containing protein n=1 Tax=Frateuria sp. TaxID=2211372 RepID=UPI002D7FD999|nr:glycine zipper 2TM domain-containing protein [Frateuria sp.]HET6805608.1 glycine zipper 2TM domain-containing protein [Frateuria sp.]
MMFDRNRNFVLAAALAGSLVLGGCATGPYDNGGYNNRGSQTSGYGSSRCENCGVVQDVQQVPIEGDNHATLGAVIGAVAGGVLGHQVGGGKGKQAATVAGAVAGGVVGHEVGKRSGSGQQLAWRVTLRLDNGQYATVTQKEDPGLRVGDYAQIRGDHVYAM